MSFSPHPALRPGPRTGRADRAVPGPRSLCCGSEPPRLLPDARRERAVPRAWPGRRALPRAGRRPRRYAWTPAAARAQAAATASPWALRTRGWELGFGQPLTPRIVHLLARLDPHRQSPPVGYICLPGASRPLLHENDELRHLSLHGYEPAAKVQGHFDPRPVDLELVDQRVS